MKDLLIQTPFIQNIDEELCCKKKISKIHIRVQQRTSKKYITIVEGLSNELDIKKILKYMKKKFVCNGTILKNEDNKIVNLSGDQRQKVKEFFINYNIVDKNNIIIHGF